MSLCTLSNTVQAAGDPPSLGAPGSGTTAASVLLKVTAELKGYDNPINDGANLINTIFNGIVTKIPVIITGFLIGYRDLVTYTIQVPFIDQLFQGTTPLTAPYSVYYLITETYLSNLNPFRQGSGIGDIYSVARKVRPLASGGANQTVSATLV